MSYNVQKNGNVYIGTKHAGKTILVKMTGYRYPVWSIVRENGIANVGRKWAGWDCQFKVAMPEGVVA